MNTFRRNRLCVIVFVCFGFLQVDSCTNPVGLTGLNFPAQPSDTLFNPQISPAWVASDTSLDPISVKFTLFVFQQQYPYKLQTGRIKGSGILLSDGHSTKDISATLDLSQIGFNGFDYRVTGLAVFSGLSNGTRYTITSYVIVGTTLYKGKPTTFTKIAERTLNPWIRLADPRYDQYSTSLFGDIHNYFVIGGSMYFDWKGGGEAYNLTTNTWSETGLLYNVSIDQYVYSNNSKVYGISSTVLVFDTVSKSFSYLTYPDFPWSWAGSPCFTNGSYIYYWDGFSVPAASGTYNFGRYSIKTNTWKALKDPPFRDSSAQITFTSMSRVPCGFVGGKGYMFLTNSYDPATRLDTLYQYTPAQDHWTATALTNRPQGDMKFFGTDSLSFYFVNNNSIYSFAVATQTWTKIIDLPQPLNYSYALANIGSTFYLGVSTGSKNYFMKYTK